MKKAFVLLPALILTIITSYAVYIYGNKYLSKKKTVTYIEYALPTMFEKNEWMIKSKKNLNTEELTLMQFDSINKLFRDYKEFHKKEIEKTTLNYFLEKKIKNVDIDVNNRVRSVLFRIDHNMNKEELSKFFDKINYALYEKFSQNFVFIDQKSPYLINQIFFKSFTEIYPYSDINKITIEDNYGNNFSLKINNPSLKEISEITKTFEKLFNEKFFYEKNRIRYYDDKPKQIQLPLAIILSVIYFVFYFIVFSLLSRKLNL